MRVRLTVGLAVMVGALSACTVKDADEAGAAGKGGSSTGGSAAGGSFGGSTTGGSAGTPAGGAAGAATAGSAGATTGGSAGATTGGSAGATTGGAGGAKPTGGAGGTAAADPCNGTSTQGKCDGNKVLICEQPPPGSTGELPRLVTNDCGNDRKCTETDKGATCVLKTACVPKDSKCSADGKSVEICKPDGSAFVSTACLANESCTGVPGKAAQCESAPQAGGAADSLRGCVTFERRGISKDGPAKDLTIEPAVLQFVAIYNGSEYIGSAVTRADDGCFDAELTAKPTAETIVYVFAMDFDSATNQPLVAVAHYPGDSAGSLPKSSTEYWHWSNQDKGCGPGINAVVQVDPGGKHTLGTLDNDKDPGKRPDMLITEACGSGAMRIFQWTRFGMIRLAPDHLGLENFKTADGKQLDIVKATEATKQDSIVVYWEKGKDVGCGACFSNKGNGPFHVDPAGDLDDLYDTAIYISGTEGNPTQWSYSVLSHELGHWVMANYSRSPGEGGPHYVGQASKPGLAYSEGWATSFGQWNVSFAGDWDPIYIDTQDGTTFFVDIAKASWTGGALQTPSKTGGIDQNINENIVASMLFKLNAGSTGVTTPVAGGQGLGPDALFKAFTSPRVTGSINRGYSRVDVVDFFDGGRCTDAIPEAAIKSVSDGVDFPWDSAQQCK